MSTDDLNIFMMCDKLNASALSEMPSGFAVRHPRESELDVWKRMPFDDGETADQYSGYMTEYFDRVYSPKGDLFYKTCVFVVDENDMPIGTGFTWKLYERFTTVHWFKTIKAYENKGIGRALISIVMRKLQTGEYPVYLHTQVGSYRAIKLYSDFGFKLLTDSDVGLRHNDFRVGLPVLMNLMPQADFKNLRFGKASQDFLDCVASQTTNDF